jgi:hypothetical protein
MPMMNAEGKSTSAETNQGIDRIVEKYRQKFRIPENLDHYTESDLHEAERRYLQFCLTTGEC